MDAFLLRRPPPLFKGETFTLLRDSAVEQEETERRGDDVLVRELQELIQTNGGKVVPVAPAGSTSSSVTIALALTESVATGSTETASIKSSLATWQQQWGATHALLLTAQWVRDCVEQKKRLRHEPYDLMVKAGHVAETAGATLDAVTTTVTTAVQPVVKKRKLADLRPHLTAWKVLHGSMYVLDARSESQQQKQSSPSTGKIKIAGFDMDGTLIVTKSGKRFAKDAEDWKWFDAKRVPEKLAQLVEDGFELVLFSNQNGIDKGNVTAKEVQTKLEAIVKKLNLPILVFLATKGDLMRKPRVGGWDEMAKMLRPSVIDMDASFYCGDAAGRPKISGRTKDFAATDYKFALNLGIQFHTPEALFLGSKQRIHTHPDTWEIGFDPRPLDKNPSTDKLLTPASAVLEKTEQEMVILVGPPASGKSFFASTRFSSYVLVNQDGLQTLSKCTHKCQEALGQQKSVIIDSTNRDVRTRSAWIQLAHQKKIPIRCFEMDVPKPLSMHLNTFRSLTQDKKIPDIAIHTFYKNFVRPEEKEGFAEIVQVHFQIDRAHVSTENQHLISSFL